MNQTNNLSAPSHFLVYRASAGSGKTYNLALQYIKQLLVSDVYLPHRHILAVTFTKDATGEMKDRILAELFGLSKQLPDSRGFMKSLREELPDFSEEQIASRADKALRGILHDYGRFHITTIDSFFQQVLRNLARELGKGSQFNIELNTSRAVDEAVDALIDRSNGDTALLGWISDYLEEQLESDQNWRIQGNLKRFGRHIFNEGFQANEEQLRAQLEANPQIFRQSIKESKALKREFEQQMEQYANRFFKQLSEHQIEAEAVFSGGKNNAVSGYFKKIANGNYGHEIATTTLKKWLDDAEAWFKQKSEYRAAVMPVVNATLMPLLQQTEAFRNEHYSSYASAQLLLKNIHQLALLDYISKELDEQSRENNRFMLPHTAMLLNSMIDTERDAAFIFEKIGAEIEHVMIDEFQDTSSLQWQNFRALLSEVIASDRFSLLVGDVKQSIYRWRNGDWRILNNIEQELPRIDTRSLDTNYRSARQVVAFNNEVFTSIADILAEKYREAHPDDSYNPFTKAYSDVKQGAKSDDMTGFVSVDFCKAEKGAEETKVDVTIETLIGQLVSLHKAGVEASDVAILCRTNDNLREIAARLDAARADYPELDAAHFLDVVSNEAFVLGASPALQIVVSALRVLVTPKNKVAKAETLLLWQRYTSVPDAVGIEALRADEIDNLFPEMFRPPYLERLAVVPLYDLVQQLYRVFSLEKIVKQESYIYTFMDKLKDFLLQHTSDISSFLDFWDDELSSQTVPNDANLSGIRASSIHKSKGLQYHSVIVPFCNWDMAKKSGPMREALVWCGEKAPPFDLKLMPIDYETQMADSIFAEEFQQETELLWMDNLNLLYVALTRAEENLMIISESLPKNGKTLRINTLLGAALDAGGDGEEQHYERGTIVSSRRSDKGTKTDNIFKSVATTSEKVTFVQQGFAREKLEFMASNEARRFVAGSDEPDKRAEYIKRGNVLHALFAQISTMDAIPSAVATLTQQGLILRSEEADYSAMVVEAIAKAGTEAWFSGDFRLINECAILWRDRDGRASTRRPDRVMLSEEETIVVDYKFGLPHKAHCEQVAEYMRLLGKMGYEHIAGYIWYVSLGEIISVKG